jgi:hypothetical protein
MTRILRVVVIRMPRLMVVLAALIASIQFPVLLAGVLAHTLQRQIPVSGMPSRAALLDADHSLLLFGRPLATTCPPGPVGDPAPIARAPFRLL